MQTSNQYHHFKVVQNIFIHFFHLIFCEQPMLFAFLKSSVKDYQTEFLDLRIQQWEFDKIIFYDCLKTRKNTKKVQVHMEKGRFPWLTSIFKLIRLLMSIVLNLKDFELSFLNPFLINDMNSLSQKLLL